MSVFSTLAKQALEEDEELSGVTIRGEDLSCLDLGGLMLADSRFLGCRMGGVILAGCTLTGVSFEDCDLSNAQALESRWERCAMTNCKAVGANVRQSRFRDSAFSGSLLRYANFTGSGFRSARFSTCDLMGSFFSTCTLGAVFQTCNLSQACFFHTPLSGLDLSSCTIDKMTLSDGGEELRGLTVDLWQAAGLARRFGIHIKEPLI
ncbi:MAG: pentapeptide repeat-containing protein [Clostridia bacterium]|nr:pentapeptide repeat-containing protein [Clostridia bacterium]